MEDFTPRPEALRLYTKQKDQQIIRSVSECLRQRKSEKEEEQEQYISWKDNHLHSVCHG